MLQIKIKDLVKVRIPSEKNVSFFDSATSIGTVVGISREIYSVKIGDKIHRLGLEDIVNKVEKMSKSSQSK